MKFLDLRVTKTWHKWWSPSESGSVGGVLMGILISLVFGGLLLSGHEVYACIWLSVAIILGFLLVYKSYKTIAMLRDKKP